MSDRLLTIGVFARRSRLSLKALRLYERLGLLSPAHVDPHTGYRRYREDQLFTARLIVGLRRLDMPLSEIARIVYATGDDGARRLQSFWDEAEERFTVQRALADRLRRSLLGAEDRFATFDVRTRNVPEQTVLFVKEPVDLHGLQRMIGNSIQQLSTMAEEHGGASGELFIIFHGEVNEDGAGPVEVCLPVAFASDRTRCEPAHPEAYVTITRAQLDWPQILSAYDAVDKWIEANGRRCIASPREVYRGKHPDDAEPTEEFCDVAFPIDRAAERP